MFKELIIYCWLQLHFIVRIKQFFNTARGRKFTAENCSKSQMAAEDFMELLEAAEVQQNAEANCRMLKKAAESWGELQKPAEPNQLHKKKSWSLSQLNDILLVSWSVWLSDLTTTFHRNILI